MKTKLSVWLHFSVVCVAFLLLLVPLFTGAPAERFTGNMIATLFYLAVYYLFYSVISSIFLQQGKLSSFFGWSFLLILVLPFVGYTLLFLSKALFQGDFSNFYEGYGWSMHFSGLKALLQAALFGSLFRMITDRFETTVK